MMRHPFDVRDHPDAGDLPEPPDPAGAYSAVVIRGDTGFVSGQFPLRQGTMIGAGVSGDMIDLELLREAASLSALNAAAQILRALGSWDRFGGLCRVDGLIAAPAEFTDHALVLDGASDTFVRLFGPVLGAHARSAASSPSLPRNAAVELVVTFAVESGDGTVQAECGPA